MAKQINRRTHNILYRIAAVLLMGTVAVLYPYAWPGAMPDDAPAVQRPTVSRPAPATVPAGPLVRAADSIMLPMGAAPTVPTDYQQLMADELAYDLSSPKNITTTAEYDPATHTYVVRTRMGNLDIATPFMLSEAQYNNWQLRRQLQQYYRERNAITNADPKQPFNVLDMNFQLGALDKIFGPGGVQLKTQGTVQLQMGVKSNKTDNPSLSLNSRRKTYFDFDSKIQATVNASVGDRLRFNMSYNTDATFDFDSKNLKLAYEGKEDDIVKLIEAGNVSMTTGSSLIRGSTALFGVKTKLQFGKLTATALLSQQNSESKTVNSRGGAQTTPFTINADQYDQNRHFFLAHYFRQNYDQFASKLPFVASGINITRIEVWITNKSGKYEQSRNLVAFMDLGESDCLGNTHWQPNPGVKVPSNNSNDLLGTIKQRYPGARNIAEVTQALAPLDQYGIEGGRDYEKVESARLLSPSEYTLNSTLGYISMKSALTSDEVLAVAFEYTYGGQVYQVGEFSSDITSTDQSLYLKMLKSTTTATRLPMWRLMMKNVYNIGGYQVQKQNFKLNIMYLSDTTGTKIPYLPVPGLRDRSLLQVMNLDRLDSNQESNSDGFFDYVEGYTILPQQGKIIFPVAEPFGAHLAAKIGDPVLAEKYCYPQLYDSTLVVARQFADKNKFILQGEYQASSGSQIRLNAMNVPRGSVIVTAGGVTLTENSDYTVDYAMGIVTITNQAIIESGQNVSVTLENQSLFSMQRKSLLGLDLQYQLTPDLNIGGTLMHFGEKALTEKVNIGDEVVNNTIFGFNLAYNTEFMWLTNLLNKIPTVNATQPSRLNLTAEYAQLVPHQQQSGSNRGSSYVDDFEATQTGIDLRNPYSWFLASTPYDGGSNPLFPEAALSNNVDYGKNRALLNWYFIDRMFTNRNSSMAPGYIKSDLAQLSNPYVREVTSKEIFPGRGRELSYGESNIIQTLNLSFYPTERGPYNLDADNIAPDGSLLNPERRWGGIMRRMDNTNFEQSNIEYIQFWLLNPFLDPDNPNQTGGDLYFNLGEVSEDILKDGLKSYENGIPADGSTQYLGETAWGRVSQQNSLTYSFDNNAGARNVQDVGLDGLPNAEEFNFQSYRDYVAHLRQRLNAETQEKMQQDAFSPLNDPAGDNYHFYRGYDYDEQRLGVLERYKRYNGVEGNSLSPEDAADPLYQSSRSTPDVEDINQDNTLNEYERYFQYRVSIRPEDLVVGRNFITDKQVSLVPTRDGKDMTVEWYQFKIPLEEYEKAVGSIQDFSTIRFARMFMTGFKAVTHLRFATLELVRGEWRTYDFNLNTRGDAPAEGKLDVSVVNIEENARRQPVNYVLPPGVTRISDPGQSQIIQLNEQSMSLKVTDLNAGDARAVYRNTQQDLRNYKRLQMWVHAESLIDDNTDLRSGELSLFIRLGSDVKQNFYEYEIPLELTPHGYYNNDLSSARYQVWPRQNFLDLPLQTLVNLKLERNAAKRNEQPGVGYNTLYTGRDPDNERHRMGVMGNPTLSDIRVMLVGVRNNSATTKDGIVWVNELKVTDFDESGGWAAKGNAVLSMSDLATVNVGGHMETAGFGGVDQSLNERRLDDYRQYNVAVQTDLGKFLPSKVKLRAPIYYSHSNETNAPKYNPLDQDVLLKDALEQCQTTQERDSVTAYALDRNSSTNFSLSAVKFDVRSKNPMPWDPANLTVNYSYSRRSKVNPTTEYENTNDYRGSLQYSYSPMIKGWRPMGKIKSKSKHLKFFKEWELQWLPNSLQFSTNLSRYYYEQQVRSAADVMFQLPVSVSKNFLWDRQLSLNWNLTKSLSLTFNSNTAARIDEPVGAVNRKLFPDRYRDWRDTVMRSVMSLGTPWGYNQTFTGSYKAPLNRIAALDFLTASANYNATYRWDRGATVDGVRMGNTVANQSAWTADGRVNFEGLFKKNKLLKEINDRFANRRTDQRQKPKPKKFDRNFQLKPDTSVTVKHNLGVNKVKVSAITLDGTAVPVKYKVVDKNTLELLDRGDKTLKLTVTEVTKDERTWLENVRDYSLRAVMSPRTLSLRYRRTRSLSLPLFLPDVGDLLGQSRAYGPMSPGLDFAFGFTDESYINRALDRGWLITGDGQTSPALWSNTNELNLEASIEPFKGFKIQLTMNRTDNRSSQVQFMYSGMPTALSGSFTMTYCAIGTALGSSKASDGYANGAFTRFMEYIPVMRERVESQYRGLDYPDAGFIKGSPLAGMPFNKDMAGVSQTSSDVLIPAFVAAYSGRSAQSANLNPFPSFKFVLPNWRVTYDGLINMWNLRDYFKSFTLNHAYQCTYSVGSYSSYLNWVGTGRGDLGFTLDELSGMPMPSSPYNISSVAITERFAPLIGCNFTLKNELQGNLEFKDQRTLTLNSSAGQLVEATTRGLTVGVGYKFVGFNTVLKMKGSQKGVSNDLTVNGDLSLQQTKALIRRIEGAYTQPTSGTNTFSANLTASYVLSKRLTMGMFFSHQANTPVITTGSYPTTSTAYGITLNLNLAR